MAYLQEQMEILKFDRRLLEINLKNGSITKEQYGQFLGTLEDVESRSEKMTLNEGPDNTEKPAEPNSTDLQADSQTNTGY